MSEDEDYWHRLAHDWTQIECPGLDGAAWRERFTSSRPGREWLMVEDVRELMAGLPERVRVWRGAVRGVNEAGLSWTATRDDAVAWAHRNVRIEGSGEAVVLRGSVAREDVIALFVERLEIEIVALPEDVRVDAVEDVTDEPVPPPRSDVEIEAA